MAQIPEGWHPVGRTDNTAYYFAEPDMLIVIPDTGLKDDRESALMNTDFQLAFARSRDHRCVVIVQMTSLLAQDAAARRIYAERMDPALYYAAALVATSAIARAIASFFLGLTKPKFPTRVFESFPDAMIWAASIRPGVRR